MFRYNFGRLKRPVVEAIPICIYHLPRPAPALHRVRLRDHAGGRGRPDVQFVSVKLVDLLLQRLTLRVAGGPERDLRRHGHGARARRAGGRAGGLNVIYASTRRCRCRCRRREDEKQKQVGRWRWRWERRGCTCTVRQAAAGRGHGQRVKQQGVGQC